MTYLSPGKTKIILETKRTVTFGTETISSRGPQMWNLIPKGLRALATLNKCKKELKNGKVMPTHAESE